MATNPNVPAEQKAAAESSAPDAKVVAHQPAQLPTAQNTPASAPAQAAQPAATPAPAAVPTTNKAAGPVDTEAGKNRKAEINQEQKDQEELRQKTEGKDYFTQQEEFAKAFEEREGEDSFRRAARIEREREAKLSEGDPTRDPVAKQKAMDENTVFPGAAEDAQKIKDIGAEKLAQDSKEKGLK